MYDGLVTNSLVTYNPHDTNKSLLNYQCINLFNLSYTAKFVQTIELHFKAHKKVNKVIFAETQQMHTAPATMEANAITRRSIFIRTYLYI